MLSVRVGVIPPWLMVWVRVAALPPEVVVKVILAVRELAEVLGCQLKLKDWLPLWLVDSLAVTQDALSLHLQLVFEETVMVLPPPLEDVEVDVAFSVRAGTNPA